MCCNPIWLSDRFETYYTSKIDRICLVHTLCYHELFEGRKKCNQTLVKLDIKVSHKWTFLSDIPCLVKYNNLFCTGKVRTVYFLGFYGCLLYQLIALCFTSYRHHSINVTCLYYIFLYFGQLLYKLSHIRYNFLQ